jgi:hypothetical protein
MSMSAELKDLKRQRREELKSLHVTYLHTKREVQRAASPGRMVRKHLGVGLGVAALAGFLLAPRPSPRVRYVRVPKDQTEQAEKEIKQGGGWLGGLLKSLGPKLAAFIPGMDGKEGEAEIYGPPAPKRGGGMGAAVMKGLVPMLTLFLKKVNVQKIVDQVVEQVSGGGRSRGGSHAREQPDVSVADVGTVKPTDFDHFD